MSASAANNKTLTPGLGLVIPHLDRVGRKLSIMEQVVDVPSQEIITKDNATVMVDGVAFYQVLDVRSASYAVANLEVALLNLVMTNIRTVMGLMDLDQLLSHRDEINARLLGVIDAASEPWGVKADAHRDQGHRAAQGPRRGDGPPDEGRARETRRDSRSRGHAPVGHHPRQGRKQAVVLEAEGRKEAAFRDAEARERSVQAEAAATHMMNEATAGGDLAALNYLVADKYVRALQAFAQARNEKVFIVPMELSSLAGTLGGISQIAASAFGEGAARAAGRPASVVPIRLRLRRRPRRGRARS